MEESESEHVAVQSACAKDYTHGLRNTGEVRLSADKTVRLSLEPLGPIGNARRVV